MRYVFMLLLLLGSQSKTMLAENLTKEQATQFAKLALKGISKEYPNKPADVINSDDDVKSPRHIHPAFYGCYDWHSAVHGHWMLVRILKLHPKLPIEAEIRAALAANLTAKNLEVEAKFFTRPGASRTSALTAGLGCSSSLKSFTPGTTPKAKNGPRI